MELRQLLYFKRIVELRSFTKAAAELRIAQPALGQQVRNLEQELGTTLLTRHSRGVTPTEAGLIVLERATHILQDIRKLKEDVGDLRGSLRGQVTIGMTPGLVELFAAPLVQRCSSEFPDIELNIVQDLSAKLVERMSEQPNALTFALVSTFVLPFARDVISESLANEQLFLVGSPELMPESTSSIAFADLANYKIILLGSSVLNRSNGFKHFVEAEAKRQDITLDIAFEMQSVSAVKDLIEQKFGVGILPFGTVRQRVEDGRLHARPIIRPTVCREICLAFPARRELSFADRTVRSVITALVAKAAEVKGAVLSSTEAALRRQQTDPRHLTAQEQRASLESDPSRYGARQPYGE